MNPHERPALPLAQAAALTPPEDFRAKLAALGVTLDDAAVAKIGDYLARLLAMNEQMNLTAITDPVEVWTRHALDALSLVPLLASLGEGAKVMDVGSGGGVPGVVLAIARPDLTVTLVEATQKKAAFLTAVCEALGLTRVTVRAERAEEVMKSNLKRSQDVVTARAVGRIAVLAPWTTPFAKRGGRVLLIKGQRADEELAEAAPVLKRLACAHAKTVPTPTGRIVVLTIT